MQTNCSSRWRTNAVGRRRGAFLGANNDERMLMIIGKDIKSKAWLDHAGEGSGWTCSKSRNRETRELFSPVGEIGLPSERRSKRQFSRSKLCVVRSVWLFEEKLGVHIDNKHAALNWKPRYSTLRSGLHKTVSDSHAACCTARLVGELDGRESVVLHSDFSGLQTLCNENQTNAQERLCSDGTRSSFCASAKSQRESG